MKVAIVGGTGHIGSHLIPMLTKRGHDITVIARGQTSLPPASEFKAARIIHADYVPETPRWLEALNSIGSIDTFVDLLGNALDESYETVRNRCNHVVACGSVWMLGTPNRIPRPEQSQSPVWDDGYRTRWQIIQEVLKGSLSSGPHFTAILPPNICGPGKIPLDTQGGRSIAVHHELAAGKRVLLPEGADVLIGPCDAEDVARGFTLTIEQPDKAKGCIFNVGSSYALTASDFVNTYGRIYGVSIPTERVSWENFTKLIPDKGARFHFEAHMCPDISAITSKLGYAPRHTPEACMQRAVDWMRQSRLI
jgi:nucleoside-diphosphate-sugar epimerase